jgi:hypothetical protein
MIESIPDPLVSMRQLLGRKLHSFFKQKEGDLVADGMTEEGLKAQVTLHPDRSGWTLFLARQQDRHYDSLVIDDVMTFSANKQAAPRIKDFLAMHKVELIDSKEV